MKVAVTAQGSNMKDGMDMRFGRCSWIIVADTETGEFSAVSNDKNLNSVQGAGIQTAETVCRQKVGAVITGHCGPKAFRLLNAAGVKVYMNGEGTVEEAFKKFKEGKLVEAGGSDVEGHWS